jgi:hypothetical protein
VTITLVLDKPLLPGAPIGTSAARVQKADSSVVEVQSVMTGAEAAVARAREDSIARAADTTARKQPPAADLRRNTIDPNRRRDTLPTDPAPKPNRAPPVTELVVKLRAPLQPATTYRVSLTGLRNLVNRTGETTRLLIVPKAAPPDSVRKPAGAARDSTTKPPAPPAGGVRTPPQRPPR